MGDVTLASPVIANLRENYPETTIEFLVSKGSLATVENNPKLNGVMIFEKPGGGFFSQWRYVNKTSKQLREKQYDVVFLLHRSFTSALIAWLAGIPIRIGHTTQGRGFLLTKKVRLEKSWHRLDNNLELLKAVGEIITHERPEYFPSEEISEVFRLTKTLLTGKRLVVINPNGVWETKRWNIEKFAELGRRIAEEENVVVVVIGGKEDEERGERIASASDRIVNISGGTSVDDIYRLCKMSEIVITNDSGPMHIAAAANAKIIAIFGPTDSDLCGPRNVDPVILYGEVDCLRCYNKTCEHLSCMDKISVDRVFDEVMKIL